MNNIDVKWYDEQHSIIIYTYGRGWGWEDFNAAITHASQLMDSVDYKVHIIMDFRNASILPTGAVTQIQRAYKNPKHHNAGMTIVVGANRFIQAIVDVGRKLTKEASKNWDLEFVTTMDAAIKLVTNVADTKEITNG